MTFGPYNVFPTSTQSMPWSILSASTPTPLQTNRGYIVTSATGGIFQFPVTANVGDVFSIVGQGLGGWMLLLNAGQNLLATDSFQSVAFPGGVATSSIFPVPPPPWDSPYSSMTFVCSVANTTFNVLNSWGNYSTF